MIANQRKVMFDEDIAQFLIRTVGDEPLPGLSNVDRIFRRFLDCLSGNHKIILHNDSPVGSEYIGTCPYTEDRVL